MSKASEILEKLQPRTEVVGIDEAQFLGDEVVEVCTKLANLGKRVIVQGLDTDYRGRPFEPMPRLLAVAEEITKLAGYLRALRESGGAYAAAGG